MAKLEKCDGQTWHELITSKMTEQGESWDDVVSHTLSELELHRFFDSGYGGPEGTPFTLWTHKRVYFPGCYDGAEFVESVPRNPCDEKTDHVGGY